jgi:hypothetical protein
MNSLAEQIKRAIDALAFADVGEPLGRRAQYAALNPERVRAEPRPDSNARKFIALGVGDSLPAPVMAYVIGACRRMHADLLLLSENAGQVRDLLAAYLPELHGIQCETEELPKATRRAVLHVLQCRTNILFAVTGVDSDPLHALLHGRRGLLEGKAPVPVVMVGDSPAKAQREHPRASRLASN